MDARSAYAAPQYCFEHLVKSPRLSRRIRPASNPMGLFSNHVTDRYLAPYVSSFTFAEIPDKSAQAMCWLDNNVLHSVLGRAYKEGTRQYVFNYLRRAEAAFWAHAEARDATQKFLVGSRQSLSAYMRALLHWETFLAQSAMACTMLRGLSLIAPFQNGDGSTKQRLHKLYNYSKHVDSVIDNGQLPEHGTTILWMTNEGLRSKDDLLLWSETSEVLDDLAQLASILEDPWTAEERTRPFRMKPE